MGNEKTKNADLAAEDGLRTFITAHVKLQFPDLDRTERAELVEQVVGVFGPSLTLSAQTAVIVLGANDDDVDDDHSNTSEGSAEGSSEDSSSEDAVIEEPSRRPSSRSRRR